MPKEVFDKHYSFLPHASLLSFEEITRLARLFVAHGVRKLRLTGGEPLLRKNLEMLVAMLAELRTPDGAPLDLTLTTNGSLLARKAQALKDAGLQRVTVSLDALDDAIFRAHERRRLPGRRRARRHRGGAARRARPDQGQHGGQARHQRPPDRADGAPLPRHFGGRSCCASSSTWTSARRNGWRMDEVLPSAEVVERLAREFPLVPLQADRRRRNRRALALCRRRRRDRRDLERDAGLLPATATAPACRPKASCSCACSRRHGHDLRALLRGGLQRRADRRRDRPDLAGPRRPLLRAAQRRRRPADGSGRAPRRDALHRRLTVPADAVLRRLHEADLPAYKALRDAMLAAEPKPSPPTPPPRRHAPRRATSADSAWTDPTAGSS